jgi:hypothetical protein
MENPQEYNLTSRQAEMFNQIIAEKRILDRRESDLMYFFFESVGINSDEVEKASIVQGKILVTLKNNPK